MKRRDLLKSLPFVGFLFGCRHRNVGQERRKWVPVYTQRYTADEFKRYRLNEPDPWRQESAGKIPSIE